MLKLQEYDFETYHCDICDDTQYIEVKDEFGYPVLERCKCQLTRKINRNLKESGLMEEFKKMSLDTFKAVYGYQKTMLDKSIEFLKQIDYTDDKHYKKAWFIVSGQVGSGKTHICTGISSQCILMGKSFEYIRYVSDMPKLAKDQMNFNEDIKYQAERKIDAIKNCEVLYIDDFLKMEFDRMTFQLVWEIIDYRYNKSKLVTIISTEKFYQELKRMDSAFASRIYERTQRDRFYVEIGREDERNYREKE